MRVIAGLYKGRTLTTVKDLSVRPATDRVKQTLFDMLVHRVAFSGCSVLDLFAGSGSLGIEALSRGASRAVFVENSREAIKFIEENLNAIGCADAAEIHHGDALGFLEYSHETFDVIFADPPYNYVGTENIPGRVMSGSHLASEGYLLIEHFAKLDFPGESSYRSGPRKKFGRTCVTFFQHSNHQTDVSG